ncbi:MAG: hypothetical protein HQL32_05655 [Planctomycetes bacterium]|nr:hypothetical protein [Planctomycetota bacterium]
MKATLHHFFERTAYSKDANEYLLRYHGLEEDEFLLIIPAQDNRVSQDDLLEEIDYLVKLDLYPHVFLSEYFLTQDIIEELQENLTRSFNNQVTVHLGQEESYPEDLITLSLKQKFAKYLFVHPAFKDDKEQTINLLHLHNNFLKWHKNSLDHLPWINHFLKAHGPEVSLQIAPAHQILPELFTSKGAGTLLSLGYQFNTLSIKEINKKQLLELLEQGFEKPLKANYIDSLDESSRIIIEKEYRGAVIFQNISGSFYLDKIVVSPQYLGYGLGSLLLDELFEQIGNITTPNPRLFWRAKLDNPYLSKYSRLVNHFAIKFPLLCGTVSDETYTYHFIGLSHEERQLAVEFMVKHPSSFIS